MLGVQSMTTGAETQFGTVVKWDRDHGFIHEGDPHHCTGKGCADRREGCVFVHYTGLNASHVPLVRGRRNVSEGSSVTFQLVEGRTGMQADDVRVVGWSEKQ